MATDPICHMTVDEKTGLKSTREGQTYYFCSLHCKEKFEAGTKNKQPEITKKIQVQGNYTCPMHPEVRKDGPGDCPKCGMPLEPLNPVEQDHDNGEVKEFWSFVFRAKILGLKVRNAGESLIKNSGHFCSRMPFALNV